MSDSKAKYYTRTAKTKPYEAMKEKLEDVSKSFGPWGSDDVMYWLEDGSMLLERVLVQEFGIFKGIT